MKKLFLIISCLLISLPTAARGTLVKLRLFKSTHRTADTINLPTKLDKAVWDGSDLKVWLTLKNNRNYTISKVKIIIEAVDRKGKVIARQTIYPEPDIIRRTGTAFADGWVMCHGKEPRSLKYIIEGKRSE